MIPAPVSGELTGKIDVYDVKGRCVVIRVPDPANWPAADFATKMFKQQGAAVVLIAKPDDIIESWSDEDLLLFGLKRV